jgi:UDP-glucose 4-epimerase
MAKAKVLVAGGAGYVGSSVCAWLLDHGCSVTVLDNFATGHPELFIESPQSKLVEGKIGDRALLKEIFNSDKFDCVMHFAAKSLVSESVTKAAEYFENNVDQTRVLIEEMLKAGVKNIVFSSTCAVFGDPAGKPLTEDLPKHPLSPYGETKLAVELMLKEFERTHGLNSVSLRYFNAAGAESKLRVGEWHDPESHLIPKLLQSAILGKQKGSPASVEVYGTDYQSRDGTCIRDYVHVSDLARAHQTAMEQMIQGTRKGAHAFNLGSGTGSTVREVIQMVEKTVGHKFNVVEKSRRPGDAPILVAVNERAQKELGFKPTDNSLEWIINTAWAWEQKLCEIKKKAGLAHV